MDGEIVLHEEGCVFHKPEVTHKAVFLADGINGYRVFILDRLDQRLACVSLGENDGRADQRISVMLGRAVAVSASDDGVVDPLRKNVICDFKGTCSW